MYFLRFTQIVPVPFFLHYILLSFFYYVVNYHQLKYVSRQDFSNIFIRLTLSVFFSNCIWYSSLVLHYFYPLLLILLTNINWNMWADEIILISLSNTQLQINNWSYEWTFLKVITIFPLIFDSYFIVANTWRRCNYWMRHYIKHLAIKSKYFKERS